MTGTLTQYALRFTYISLRIGAAAVPLGEQVFAGIEAPGRAEEEKDAGRCADDDEERGRDPEWGRVTELAGLDFRMANGFVDEPHGEGRADQQEYGRTAAEERSGRKHGTQLRHRSG